MFSGYRFLEARSLFSVVGYLLLALANICLSKVVSCWSLAKIFLSMLTDCLWPAVYFCKSIVVGRLSFICRCSPIVCCRLFIVVSRLFVAW